MYYDADRNADYENILLCGILAAVFCACMGILPATESPPVVIKPPVFNNMLVNPEFRFHPIDARLSGGVKGGASGSVTCWSTDAWGDIEVDKPSNVAQFKPSTTGNVVRIRPGKRFWQFAANAG